MTKTIIITFVVLLGGGGAWFVTQDSGAQDSGEIPESSLFTVVQGDLPISITEDGTLVAKKSRKVTMKSRRHGKITFLVEEGKKVAEGEVVCRFDTTDLEQRIETTELDIVQAVANLKSSQTDVEIQEGDNKATVEKAENALDRAAKELERYRDGDAPKERRKLDIAIKDAETKFRQAKKRFEDSKILMEQDFIKKTELEQDQIAYERAVVERDGAKLDLKMFEKYTLPMKMDELGTKVKDARRDLDNAKKKTESQLLQKKVRVQQNEKRLERLKKSLEERKEDLAHMTLKAPCPGIVIYGDPRQSWYRENVKVGGTIWGGNTVMTIPDLRVMQVRTKIHEADINKVKLEQPVTITMPTYPGLILHGKVTRIASIAGSNNPYARQSEVKKFDVEMTIEDEDLPELKPGISAKAVIHVDIRKDAVHVPLQCVFTEEGKCYTYVLNGTEPERREVTVGLNNDSHIEILSGLDKGERVLMFNPNISSGGDGGGEEEKDGAGAGSGKGESTGGTTPVQG